MRFLVIYVLFKTINNNQYLHIMIMYVVGTFIYPYIYTYYTPTIHYDSRMTNKVYPKFKHHINHTMKCNFKAKTDLSI